MPHALFVHRRRSHQRSLIYKLFFIPIQLLLRNLFLRFFILHHFSSILSSPLSLHSSHLNLHPPRRQITCPLLFGIVCSNLSIAKTPIALLCFNPPNYLLARLLRVGHIEKKIAFFVSCSCFFLISETISLPYLAAPIFPFLFLVRSYSSVPTSPSVPQLNFFSYSILAHTNSFSEAYRP